MRLIAYNIHHGEGMDERIDLERIAILIDRLTPDLVTLQEVDRAVERTGFIAQAARLGELTGLRAVFGQFMEYQGGEYGMAILSRWPVAESTNHRLPDGAEPRSALAVTVVSPRSGRRLELVGIHLYRSEQERLAQAAALSEIYADVDHAVILAGDFNSRPGSSVLELLGQRWQFIDKGSDRLTFPSHAPDREIDFVAYRPANGFEVLSQRLIDEPVISDHRPLVVELAWR